MEIKQNIVLERTKKKPIVIDAFYSKSKNNQPIIIFCHGYKGFKDWGAWNLMARDICNEGFCFIKFNFSHNGGTTDNPIDFPDLEAFGNNNYSKELDDLEGIINWIQKNFSDNKLINTNNITLMGHSRGGGIAIIKASENSRISKLVTLASVSDFGTRTYTIGNLKEWKENGVKYVINGRTKQKMPHFYQFYEDFKVNEKRFHIESAMRKLNIPVLVIHGDRDTSINLDEAEKLHEWKPGSTLDIIENADHVFNTKHPWNKNKVSKELQKVTVSIVKFLK